MGIEEAKKIVAEKYGLGSTLVMGHREKYWHEAIEMVIKDKDRQLDEKTMAYSELGSNYSMLLFRLSKRRWIDVKEELPEFNESVIGYFPEGTENGCLVAPAISNGKEVHSDYPNSTASFFIASHWMRYPDPPKK